MLSTYRFLTLALVALSLFQVIDASQLKRATNAERLARGFKPARPKRLYDPTRKFARDALSATTTDTSTTTSTSTDTSTSPTDTTTSTPTDTTTSPTDTSTSPTTTPTPPPPSFATIVIVSSGSPPSANNAIGYIGINGATTDPSSAAHFAVPDYGVLTEMSYVDLPTFKLGPAASSSSASAETLSTSNRNALPLEALSCHTDANAPPTSCEASGGGSFVYGETTVFTVDPTTLKITPSWVNPDGSHSTMSSISVGQSVYITGNPAGARLTLGGGITVDLYLVLPATTATTTIV